MFTAVGVCTAAGGGVGFLEQALVGPRQWLRELPYPPGGLQVTTCAVVPGIRREQPAAALLQAAIDDAALPALPPGAGLVLATASGGRAGAWEAWHAAHPEGPWPGPPAGERQGPLAWLAERLGLRGPRAAVSLACASGLAALERAAAWLQEGRCEVVLVAAVDALCPFVHVGFEALGVLSPGRCRPFLPDRDGTLLGEGAAVLLLETPAHAAQAGRRPLAALQGLGLWGESHSAAAPDPQGRGVREAAGRALAAAGLAPEDLDLVSPHATGTRLNDAAEAGALETLFGGRVPPLRLVKPLIGHTLGAAGALAVALELVALQEREALPTTRLLGGVPGPVLLPRTCLLLAAAFGGSCAAAVLGPPGAPRPLAPRRAVRWLGQAQGVAVGGSLDAAHRAVALAVAELARRGALPAGCGAALSAEESCRAADLAHQQALTRPGGRVSRRVFLHTMPAAPLLPALRAVGVEGPVLALLGGPEGGAEAAQALVRSGRAPAALHVDLALEGDGPLPAARAVATLYGGGP